MRFVHDSPSVHSETEAAPKPCKLMSNLSVSLSWFSLFHYAIVPLPAWWKLYIIGSALQSEGKEETALLIACVVWVERALKGGYNKGQTKSLEQDSNTPINNPLSMFKWLMCWKYRCSLHWHNFCSSGIMGFFFLKIWTKILELWSWPNP